MKTKTTETEARGGHSLPRLVRPMSNDHNHAWVPTHANGSYVSTQERCVKCGEIRHRVFDATKLSDDPEWKPGPLPTIPRCHWCNGSGINRHLRHGPRACGKCNGTGRKLVLSNAKADGMLAENGDQKR